jgi:hypothetical protein
MNENQTTIGGRVISVGWLPPTEAVKVEVALIGICGEALFKALGKKGADAEETGAAVIAAMSSKIDPDVLVGALQRIHSVVTIDGKRPPFDEAYTGGRHKEMWQVTFFALRYNFRDFFPESLFTSVKAKMGQALNPLSSPTSLGTSGDQ